MIALVRRIWCDTMCWGFLWRTAPQYSLFQFKLFAVSAISDKCRDAHAPAYSASILYYASGPLHLTYLIVRCLVTLQSLTVPAVILEVWCNEANKNAALSTSGRLPRTKYDDSFMYKKNDKKIRMLLLKKMHFQRCRASVVVFLLYYLIFLSLATLESVFWVITPLK